MGNKSSSTFSSHPYSSLSNVSIQSDETDVPFTEKKSSPLSLLIMRLLGRQRSRLLVEKLRRRRRGRRRGRDDDDEGRIREVDRDSVVSSLTSLLCDRDPSSEPRILSLFSLLLRPSSPPLTLFHVSLFVRFVEMKLSMAEEEFEDNEGVSETDLPTRCNRLFDSCNSVVSLLSRLRFPTDHHPTFVSTNDTILDYLLSLPILTSTKLDLVRSLLLIRTSLLQLRAGIALPLPKCHIEELMEHVRDCIESYILISFHFPPFHPLKILPIHFLVQTAQKTPSVHRFLLKRAKQIRSYKEDEIGLNRLLEEKDEEMKETLNEEFLALHFAQMDSSYPDG